LLLAAAILPLALTACAARASQAIPAAAPAAPAAAPSTAGQAIPAQPAAPHESLSETGSTLLFPLLHAWAGAYHQRYPQVSISTGATGSGTGIKDASAGTVAIGASDAYLSSGAARPPIRAFRTCTRS
jgi:phosphate transport system substrate-binding protein